MFAADPERRLLAGGHLPIRIAQHRGAPGLIEGDPVPGTEHTHRQGRASEAKPAQNGQAGGRQHAYIYIDIYIDIYVIVVHIHNTHVCIMCIYRHIYIYIYISLCHQH